MTQRITLVAFLLLLAAGPVRADAEAAKEFDKLFGDAVRQAMGTLDVADDIALAHKLLEAAKTVTDKPALMAVMLEKAYDLSARDSTGTATAIDAMETLADRQPDRRVAATQKVLTLLQRDYTKAKAAELATAGGAYIEKLVELGEAHASAGDYAGAVADYSKALPISTRIKSPQEPVIKARITALTHRQRVEAQIAALQERILKDRTDKNAANDLAILYVTELDKPSAAQQYMDAITDDEIKKNVPMAAKEVGELAGPELMTMATWYEGLSKKVASVPAKKITLTRAEKYLESYIEKQTSAEQNLVKLQAELALKRVQAAIKDLTPEVASKEPAEKLFTFTGKPLAIDAEKAQVIEEPMKIERTSSANNGAFIWKPGTIGQRALDGPGHVVFHVKTAEATEVYIWGRVRSLDAANNSFYLAVAEGKVTTGTKRRWDLPEETRNWVWAPFSEQRDRGGRGGPGGGRFGPPQREPEPQAVKLEAGVNSIMIFPREHGAQLDGIYISKTNEKPK
jgi:tetratricopeptide (TPR) repeat protein